MNASAIIMMLFGFLLLYGGLGVCLYIAWRCHRGMRAPRQEPPSAGETS